MKRRELIAAAAFGAVGTILTQPARGSAQQGAQAQQGQGGQARTNFAPMDANGYQPVERPPKANAKPSMNEAALDELEHNIQCMCGCTLNVYWCRTTDFTCPVSPAMHKDVQTLVAGGYSAQEILDAFASVYGERVLSSPKREGFNWAGYIVPFVAMASGAVVVTMLLKKWSSASGPAPVVAGAPRVINASADELDRLNAAVRNDEDDDE